VAVRVIGRDRPLLLLIDFVAISFRCFVYKICGCKKCRHHLGPDNMLSRFHLIPERYGRTDGQIYYINIARQYAEPR